MALLKRVWHIVGARNVSMFFFFSSARLYSYRMPASYIMNVSTNLLLRSFVVWEALRSGGDLWGGGVWKKGGPVAE